MAQRVAIDKEGARFRPVPLCPLFSFTVAGLKMHFGIRVRSLTTRLCNG